MPPKKGIALGESAGSYAVGSRPRLRACRGDPKVSTSPVAVKAVKLVAEASKELSGVGMRWVAVAGSQDRRLWKDENWWISILAVGGEKRNRGVLSDGEGVFPPERLFRDALSGEHCQQVGGAGVCVGRDALVQMQTTPLSAIARCSIAKLCRTMKLSSGNRCLFSSEPS